MQRSRLASLIVVASLGGTLLSTPAGSEAAPTSSWTVYHGAADGSGVGASVGSVDLSHRQWTSPALDGELYGEPLVSGGRVYVATENDTVYALSARTGAVTWSTHLGTAVPSGELPCGDISPRVGITGTPVVDEARQEVFVVADELVSGRPAHMLVGLNATTGAIQLSQDVDPPGSSPPALLERTGLTLDAGNVVFGYGGNFGDCSTYRGWVVSVPETGGTPADFGVDAGPGETEGAIWMGGAAPVVDASGNIWVTTANGSVTSPQHSYDDSEAVLELSPSLALLQYFAPATWASDNARDLDLSTAPALLSTGQVVASGKTRAAYLLNAHALGGVGAQHAELDNVCGSTVDGGVAIQGTTVFLPCLDGPVAVAASSPGGFTVLWHASVGGGPPILAAGLVWTISQDGHLFALDPSTGRAVMQAAVGPESNHFPTPSVGAGLLLVPGSTQVVAFAASAPGATTTTTARPSATTHPTSASAPNAAPTDAASGRTGWVRAGIAVGGLAVIAGLLWLLLAVGRRRS